VSDLAGAAWKDFFIVYATAAAALVGLLFVACSLHVERLASDRVLRRRAQNHALVMMLLFLQAMAFLIPQSDDMLSAEIVAINVAILYFPISAIWLINKAGLSAPYIRIVPTIACSASGLIGALLLLQNWPWSVHLIAIPACFSLFLLVVNAWSLMLGTWRTDLLEAKSKRLH
jgi:modulator of FtsH protease